MTPFSWSTVFVVWGFCGVTVLGMWLRRFKIKDSVPPDVENPELASGKEAAVLLAREMYERGDFKRAIVRRTAVDLFSDDLVLECGHKAHELSRWEESKNELLRVRPRLDRERKQSKAESLKELKADERDTGRR